MLKPAYTIRTYYFYNIPHQEIKMHAWVLFAHELNSLVENCTVTQKKCHPFYICYNLIDVIQFCQFLAETACSRKFWTNLPRSLNVQKLSVGPAGAPPQTPVIGSRSTLAMVYPHFQTPSAVGNPAVYGYKFIVFLLLYIYALNSASDQCT